MRIRKMKFCDYGIDEEEKNVLMELAKREENAVFIRKAVMESNPGLSEMLFISLTTGIGYDAMGHSRYIPIKRDDFYAYRRRALYIFKLLLKRQDNRTGPCCFAAISQQCGKSGLPLNGSERWGIV